MVFFTCQHCGESVRKSGVEKHYYQKKCQYKSPNLTCVDCLKDFFGNEYVDHISCLTEDQKYSAKGTVFKEAKGKKKQEQYINIIQSLLHTTNLPPRQKALLEAIQGFDNVPRKLKPFQNFLRSNQVAKSLKLSPNDVTSVFQLIDKAFKQENASANMNKTSALKSPELKEENDSLGGEKELSASQEKVESDQNGNAEAIKENLDGLTRKELKKKRKHEKYLKELENAQTEMVPDISMEGVEDENIGLTKKKKSKKSKKNKLEETPVATEVELEEASLNAQENGLKQKKSKKRKLEISESVETEEKRSKLSPAEDENQTDGVQTSFDWSDVIVRVLESKPEKELSLKKLAKKVVNEYLTVKPDHHTYEDLMAKFNKKVKKTRNVRVLKDRAKLIDQ